MALDVTHTTAADGTFSGAGTTAWNATHSIANLNASVETWLATPSSANLAAALTDETGTGAAVFANSPALVTPALGTPSSGVATNMTGLPYSIQFSASSSNPADAQTNYFGLGGGPFTTAAVFVVPVPKTGTITDVFLEVGVGGTLGTAGQTITAAIGLNNTTYTTISSAVETSAARQQYSITAQSIAVTAGDFLQIRLVYPTWTTNPTSVIFNAIAIVRTT